MIKNTNLIIKYNGDLRKVHHIRNDIVENLKNALKTYFKALGLNNYIIGDYTNGDLRITVKNEVFPLNNLLDLYGLKYSKETYKNNCFYRIYVFY